MWSSLLCFCTFCCSAIPTSCYILNVFYYLFMSIFSSLSTCLSWSVPSHSSRSLSQAATDIWTIDSGISYTGVLAEESLTQASFQTLSQPFSGWMTKPALPVKDLGSTTHRSRHSKSMDNTSLNHSDIFILMIGTYLSLFKCLVRLTTQRILCFFDPMPRYTAY